MSKKTIQKIDAQIARIESIIEQLLDGIDIAELSVYERLVVASRFLGLAQRGLVIRQTVQIGQPENREGLLVAAYMRQMRGESPVPDDLRIIEEEIAMGRDGLEEEDG